MIPIVISYYTKDTPYEQEVQKLIASCQQFDIECQIEARPSLGSWEKNCAQKSNFILQKLQEIKRPVLWVDADAVFLQKPDLSIFSECDFSVRVNEFLPKDHASRIVSNTIFVNTTALEVVQAWVDLCAKELNQVRQMEFWDQAALRDVLAGLKDLKFLEMPLKFSKIFDFDDLFISEGEVVIEHYQASRRFKKQIHESCCHHHCH